MAAPNRKAVIERVLEQHKDQLIVPRKGNEEPRRMFLPLFIAAMPAEDDGNWGVLRKSTGTVPSDILVWKPNNDHFDVSTANEIDGDPDHYKIAAVWKNHGDIKLRNKAWNWMDVHDANIPPLPGAEPKPDPKPDDEPPPPPPSGNLEARVAALEAFVKKLREI